MHRTRLTESGSALIATLLVGAALVLLGITLLATTATERALAHNERGATCARYAAEAAARAVKGWFELSGTGPGFPSDPQVFVRQRLIIDESNPYGAPPKSGGPQYKQGVDLDGDGQDDLLRPPYRGGSLHELLGSESGPDLRITDAAALAVLSRVVYGDAPELQNLRIQEIDVFAPPYVLRAGTWVRQGVGTIKVTAAVIRPHAQAAEGPLAVRTVRLVLTDLPYAPPGLPVLGACGNAELVGPVGLHWGTLEATGQLSMPEGFPIVESVPRGLPTSTGEDRLFTDDEAWLGAFTAAIAPGPLADPWVRLAASGSIVGAPSAALQPYAGPLPPPPGTPTPWPCCDRSNLYQHQAWIHCPDHAYEFWKSVARSGWRGTFYHAWDATGGGFRTDGSGPVQSFDAVLAEAAGTPGLHFFDTLDGIPPHDDDGDGVPDNLTPPIVLAGPWIARGFVFVNAESILVDGLIEGLIERHRAPAEPANITHTAWIDLTHPAIAGLPVEVGPPGAWDAVGPEFESAASFRGILVTSGTFEAKSGGTFIGAVSARSLVLDGRIGPATRFFADPELAGSWPPSGWALPRLVATRIAVD